VSGCARASDCRANRCWPQAETLPEDHIGSALEDVEQTASTMRREQISRFPTERPRGARATHNRGSCRRICHGSRSSSISTPGPPSLPGGCTVSARTERALDIVPAQFRVLVTLRSIPCRVAKMSCSPSRPREKLIECGCRRNHQAPRSWCRNMRPPASVRHSDLRPARSSWIDPAGRLGRPRCPAPAPLQEASAGEAESAPPIVCGRRHAPVLDPGRCCTRPFSLGA